MGASGSHFNSQNRTEKLRHYKIAENGSDIISNLPESVLTHILSFLPTKDVVCTSLLSTKWKYMWTKVTNLHFDDELLSSHKNTTGRQSFMNFVERVLLHLENSTIESFHLSCDSNCDASRINAWISAVIWRQVQRLDIRYLKEDFVFPRCILESDSLTELSLRMNCIMNVSTPCFSRLEILDLYGVTFLNTHLSNSRVLSFSFPVLQVLSLDSTKWLNVKVLNLDVPELRSFSMGPDPNGSDDCVVKICGQNLKRFKCSSYLSEEFVLSCTSSVVDATIEVYTIGDYYSQQKTVIGLRACNLLRMFLGVEHLKICGGTIKALAHIENLQALLPTYNNLVQLTISWNRGFSGTIMALLRSSPVLETLIFGEGICEFDKQVVGEMVPRCFLSHLKVIEFRSFQLEENVLDLVKFLLKNAMVLEEMIITAAWNLLGCVEIELEPLEKQLSKFPRGSSHATIFFS